MAIIQALVNNTPRYFATQEQAFDAHYSEGGYLWRRMNGLPDAYKPYASGVLPVSRLAIYELYMVNGNQPNADDVERATKACYDQRDRNDQAWFNAPL